jgi:hypothetical protein
MDRAVRLRVLLIAVCVALAVVVGLAVAGQDGSEAAFVAAHTRRGAERDAALLLDSVVLPAGGKRLSREPHVGGGELASSGPYEGYWDLVDRHGWWRVPGSWRSVMGFVRAHPPAGSRAFGSGWGGTAGRQTSAWIMFGWPTIVGSRTRQLTVLVATTPGDATYLRVDADVVWLLPRPASERIPDGVQAIDITRGLPGQPPSQSLTMTDAAEVKSIVVLANRLPIIQPGEFDGCNTAEPFGDAEPKITFTFRAAPGGPVLALAKESAQAIEPGTCKPMSLSIGGVRQTPLLQGPKLVAETEHLLNEKIR